MKHIAFTLNILMLINSSVFAQYFIVDDFSTADSIYQETNMLASGAQATIEAGRLKIEHGEIFSSTSNLFCMVDMGVDLHEISIEQESSVIVYFELMQPTVESTRVVLNENADPLALAPDQTQGHLIEREEAEETNIYFVYPDNTEVLVDEDSFEVSLVKESLTDKAKVDVAFGLYNTDEAELSTDRYYGFNAMCRIYDVDQKSLFVPRDGDQYVSEDAIMLDADVTYGIWMLADFSTGYYRLYIEGDSFDEHNATYNGTGKDIITAQMHEIGTYSFRTAPLLDESVDKFTFITSRGDYFNNEKGVDHIYFDNLYVDTYGPEINREIGWIDHPSYGTAYRYADEDNGSYIDEWLYLYDAESFIYVGSESENGDWVWYQKP